MVTFYWTVSTLKSLLQSPCRIEKWGRKQLQIKETISEEDSLNLKDSLCRYMFQRMSQNVIPVWYKSGRYFERRKLFHKYIALLESHCSSVTRLCMKTAMNKPAIVEVTEVPVLNSIPSKKKGKFQSWSFSYSDTVTEKSIWNQHQSINSRTATSLLEAGWKAENYIAMVTISWPDTNT